MTASKIGGQRVGFDKVFQRIEGSLIPNHFFTGSEIHGIHGKM